MLAGFPEAGSGLGQGTLHENPRFRGSHPGAHGFPSLKIDNAGLEFNEKHAQTFPPVFCLSFPGVDGVLAPASFCLTQRSVEGLMFFYLKC